METAVWEAPAKLNLVLEVVGRRPDGFHELRTVLQAIDLVDRLTIEPADRYALTCDGLDTPVEDNLVTRAYRALAERGGVGPVRIHLEKRIPLAGGLGGGSSDAAAVLVALNALYSLGLDPDELQTIGASIGSDVAFFVRGGTQLGLGRGERLERWPDIRGVITLVVPRLGVPTAHVFAAGGFGRAPADPIGALRRALDEDGARGAGDRISAVLFNALEAPAIGVAPAVGRLRDRLAALAGVARVSGAGSTLFALAPDEATARQWADALADDPDVARTLVTRTRSDGVRRVAGPRTP